jgi:glycosyltransferase involved in cell wall biosynthesis
MAAMPAYNEEKYIGSMVLQLRQYAGEVMVVDDGSIDRTSKIAELAGATVVRHPQNEGYGRAIQSILAEARKRDPDVLVILDADTQHNPDEIPHLVKAISEGADVVIGSRETQGKVIPRYRRLGQRVLSTLTNISSRKKLSDTESGFRAYSRKAIARLELKERGMAISSEIISAAASQGLRITEVPISVTYTGDSSTINPVIHGMGVFNRIFIMISERRPLLTFGIVGGIFIAFGIFIGVLVIKTLEARQILQTGSALLSMLFITTGVLSISTGVILSVLVRRIEGSLRPPDK